MSPFSIKYITSICQSIWLESFEYNQTIPHGQRSVFISTLTDSGSQPMR
jgi:hypothetical protein